MELMLSPEPMPVEVISALAAAALLAVLELVVLATELIDSSRPAAALAARALKGYFGIETQDLNSIASKRRTKSSSGQRSSGRILRQALKPCC
jgi:hypothetical protein